ncbi:50S ribosomal protein L28 [Sesbania bispinosa]|nr:50S ribosomal protein L28 [Sesbania bispinosa]
MAGCAVSLGSSFSFAVRTVAENRTHKPSSSAQLGFLTSQLSGLRICSTPSPKLPTPIVAAPFHPVVARNSSTINYSYCPFHFTFLLFFVKNAPILGNDKSKFSMA